MFPHQKFSDDVLDTGGDAEASRVQELEDDLHVLLRHIRQKNSADLKLKFNNIPIANQAFLKLLVLSQCKTTSAYEEPRSSGNECTNSLVVKITTHYTSPCYFLYALCNFVTYNKYNFPYFLSPFSWLFCTKSVCVFIPWFCLIFPLGKLRTFALQ